MAIQPSAQQAQDVNNKQPQQPAEPKAAAPKTSTSQASMALSEQPNELDPVLLYLSLVSGLILLMCVGWLVVKNRAAPEKRQLRENFNRFILSEDKTFIAIYRRHQQQTDVNLAIKDIRECRVLLNGRSLLTLNSTLFTRFDNVKEQQLRTDLSNEYRHKMLSSKVRHVCLLLKSQRREYKISIYMRIGSQRFTKSSYQQMIEQLIDWCWFIGQQLSTEPLAARLKTSVSVVAVSPKNTVATQQVADATNGTGQELAQSLTSATVSALTPALADEHQVVNGQWQQSEQDKSLVEALAKLSQLKQQGFLDEQEFSAAKAKLMQDLLG